MFGFDHNQQKTLHLTWLAFFLTFFAWFNLTPFNSTLIFFLGFSEEQIKVLMVANVALTIPARIFIGPLVDRFGPRIVFSILLVFSALSCFIFAQSDSFFGVFVSRLLMGVSGAGFVVGIRMISEWFPERTMGIAQGIYGGLGVFGASGAMFLLPWVASFFDSGSGWRMAANFSGILCLFWAFIYFWKAKDNLNRYSSSTAYETLRPSSNQDKWLFTFLMAPAYAAMGAAAWKLSMPVSYDIESSWFFMILCALAVGFIYHILKFWNISIKLTSKSSMRNGQFRYLCILSVVYALTFGSELAVISFFPQFLQNTFGLSVIQAGMWGATFPLMNLITRPSGGWLSDVWGRKRTLAFLIFGAVICYKFMGDIDSTWSLGAAISVSVLCSIFLAVYQIP